VLKQTAFILACLVLPILWGVLVNWLFQLWQNRQSPDEQEDDWVFPDYQI